MQEVHLHNARALWHAWRCPEQAQDEKGEKGWTQPFWQEGVAEELVVETLDLVRVAKVEEVGGEEACAAAVPCSAVCCDSHWAHGSDSPCSRCLHKIGMRCTFHNLCSSTRCA